MRFRSWDNYIDAMLSQVKFRFDHGEIRQEYEEHMEDKLEFLMDCGMDEERAAREVLAEMGEPESLGKALNEIHNPLLGWIWWVSNKIVKLIIAVLIFAAASSVLTTVPPVISYARPSDVHGDIVEICEINQKFTYYYMDVIIDKAEFYEDRTMLLKYRTRKHFFDRAPGYGFSLAVWFTDEDGKEYGAGGMERQSLYRGFGVADVSGIGPDSEKIILDYENIYLEIPVPESYRAGEQ
ncbi:MAG: hypothetical protein IJB73_05525 [Firmicutes bacterium]|nr:hypothetical protein [Bacillota bacterium]